MNGPYAVDGNAHWTGRIAESLALGRHAPPLVPVGVMFISDLDPQHHVSPNVARSRSQLRQDVAVNEEVATDALFDAVALWEVRSTFGAEEVISAAVEALVAGVDSPSLRELAGLSAQDSYWTLRPLVEGTLEELNISYPGTGSDDVEIAAARVMSKRLLRGGVTARDFATWAHRTIGHEGAARLQPLVELDDVYDVCEYTDRTLEDLVVRRC